MNEEPRFYILMCVTLFCVGLACFSWGFTKGRAHETEHVCTPILEENLGLRAILADPHHCISICQEEFEKYGC